jgi:uncharacterized cofD-like protein
MSPRGPLGYPVDDRPRVVALGGGHGLAATLTALRRVTDQITAVVGVADDGGSSGRLREQFGILPPGDLRMALAALCGDDTWGRTWSRVVQHRFGGNGDLSGHSLGNLLITALWEQTHDPVEGLEWVAALLEAQGRVLPCTTVPLEIVADVRGLQPGDPTAVTTLRGQVSVASTVGEVLDIKLEPQAPPACPEAVASVHAAQGIVLGPGSWFTSVLPHLLIPDLAEAIVTSQARRIVVMNVDPAQDRETAGLPLAEHLRVMQRLLPALRVDVVIVDPADLDDHGALRAACEALGAHLDVASVRSPARSGTHDPDRLAVALRSALARP